MIGNKILKDLTHQEQKQLFEALELLGNADVAKTLGWSTSKVTNYTARGALPQPIGQVSGRPVWTKKQIDKYINGRGQV